jgi:hypothetical protein
VHLFPPIELLIPLHFSRVRGEVAFGYLIPTDCMLSVNEVVRGAVWILLSNPITGPINRPSRDSPEQESSAFISTHRVIDTFTFSRAQYQVAFGYLIPTFGVHRVRSSKTTLTMPLRRVRQRLHPDEGLLYTSDQT